MKRIILLALALVFVIAGVFQLTAQSEISAEQMKRIKNAVKDYDKAPDFTLKHVQTDSTISLSDFEGKVVLVNFWATWCYPCRIEIPDFNHLYKKYADDGLEILGVSVSDTQKSLKNFMKSYQMDYPVLYGSGLALNEITAQYGGVGAVPTSVLISRKGEVVRTFPGAILKGQPMYYTFLQLLEEELKQDS